MKTMRAKVGFLAAISTMLVAAIEVGAMETSIEGTTETASVPTGQERVVRARATEVAGNDLAVDELLRIARLEEESLRIAAVEVLGEMSSPRARAVLGVVLYSNTSPVVRAAAAHQLGRAGDGEAVFTLALALESERDAGVREVIASNVERNLALEEALPGVVVAQNR